MKHRASQAGMTLTELLVVSSILVILTGLIYETFRHESVTYARETARGATQADLRVWMVRMVKDIRNAAYDPTGTVFGATAPAIIMAQHTDLEFQRDYDKNGVITTSDPNEQLGYRLSPSGDALQLLQGSSTWRTVVPGVTSLVFTYHDAQGREIVSPAWPYQDVAEVRITIAAQGSDSSSSITETGRALIRNPNPL